MGRRSASGAVARRRTSRAAAATTIFASLASSSSSSVSAVSAFVAPAALAPSRTFHRRNNPANCVSGASVLLRAYTDGHDRSSHLPVDIPTTSKKPLQNVLPNGARITLCGSGPGDPSLLTVAAHSLLTSSDPNTLIIADRLVSPEILEVISNECEVRVANKHPGCQHEAQAEIYRWVQEGVNEGRHVVRLKIGDPFVFGRGGEEVLEFREAHGIEATVIPGVSAAFSAPLLGSIPVTHRGVANQVVMCTGYGRDNTSPDLIRYHPEQTVVFLMAVGRLRQLSQKLIEMAGYPKDTAVGIVERAGCPGQRTVVGTLETIGDVAEECQVKPPSTIVVGEVVRVLLEEDESGEAVAGLVKEATAGAELA